MPVFDGPNKIITLDSPITDPVQDAVNLYSRWKDWARTGDNAKFLPAFANSVGGQPTNPPERISAYVFVNNDLGWRIRPFEASGDTFLEGDLFPSDPGLPLFIPTIGVYNTSVRQLVSSKALQVETGVSGLTAAEAQQLNEVHGQIGRQLWIDPASVSDGAGFQQDPFNNINSLVTEAANSGIKFVKILSDLTLDRDMLGYDFSGRGLPIVDFAGFNINGLSIDDCILTGTMQGEIRLAKECQLNGIVDVRGAFLNCGLFGTMVLQDGARIILNRCYSAIAGLSRPEVSFANSTGACELNMRDYSGGIIISNMANATDVATVELGSGGRARLEATNVDGTISVRGIGYLEDLSGAGCTVDTTAFLNAEDSTNMRKLSTNRLETDPTTGIITVYDDDDTTILYQGNIWENVLANQIYRGRGLERRDQLTYLP